MAPLHPNSLQSVHARWKEGRVSIAAALLSLPMRVLLCVAVQAAAALIAGAAGAAAAWTEAAQLWPLYGSVANLLTIWILGGFLRREGLSLSQLWSPGSVESRNDIGAALVAAAIGLVLVAAVHFGLSALLFDSARTPLGWLHGVGPWYQRWAFSILYTVTGAFAVYPLFMGFAAPRLAAVSGLQSAALFLVTLWFGAQYIGLPFIADWKYLVWRLVLFMPLAWVFSATVLKRPGTLRYLMAAYVVIHIVVLLVVEGSGPAALPNYPE